MPKGKDTRHHPDRNVHFAGDPLLAAQMHLVDAINAPVRAQNDDFLRRVGAIMGGISVDSDPTPPHGIQRPELSEEEYD
jgi:hypothetical protein